MTTCVRLTLALGLALVVTASAWAQRPGGATPFDQYPKNKPALGEAAPDFVLKDLDGKEFRLQDVLGKKPIVIEFGSYT
jgi:cytochrome oxidase Cu insertion factor (SCO1/SenC/PrrC family)